MQGFALVCARIASLYASIPFILCKTALHKLKCIYKDIRTKKKEEKRRTSIRASDKSLSNFFTFHQLPFSLIADNSDC
jgi:hypothetical protein